MRLLLRFLAMAAGLVLALVAIEALMRVLDPYGAVTQAHDGRVYQQELVVLDADSPRIFRHRPNAEVRMLHHVFRTDSRGLRGPELETPKPPGTRRLFFLGDSVVLGWGVAEEDTFVHLAQERLRAATGERWETINGGHLLHDTTQELGVLEEVGFAYEPDLVVLVFVENDVVSTRAVFELQTKQAGTELSDEALKVLRRTKQLARIKPFMPATHAVLEFLYVRSSPAGQQGSAEHARELGIPLEEGWDASRTAMRRMKELTAERGLAFAVLDYRRGTPLSEKLEAFCREEAIPYASIALTPEEEAQDVRNSAADAHANPLGHRFLTDHVMHALHELRLVEGLDG